MLAWMLVTSGGLLLLGSLVAYVTGENVGPGRTHFEATMVLGVLGVVCLVAAAFPIYASVQRSRVLSSARTDDAA